MSMVGKGADWMCETLATVKVLSERHSKSVSNSLNSLEAFPIMRHHLRVVFLFMHHRLI